MAAELVDLRALMAEHERRVEERFGYVETFMKNFTDGSSINVQSMRRKSRSTAKKWVYSA